MPTVTEWALGRIGECAPESGSDRATPKVNDLVAALIFLDGRSSQLFGMTADASSLDDRPRVRAACETALRGWLKLLKDRDPEAHLELYRALTVRGDFADVPVPEAVRAERAILAERAERLAALGEPADTLVDSPSILADVEQLRAALVDVSFEVLEGVPGIPKLIDLGEFGSVLADDWAEIASLGLPPDFYPIANDGGGNYLGVLLDVDLLRSGHAPLVLYFHEHDPVYTWVFESAALAANALRTVADGASWDEGLRGIVTDDVRSALTESNDLVHRRSTTPTRETARRWLTDGAPSDDEVKPVYEAAGHRFAQRNLMAQRMWDEANAKLRALRSPPAR